MFPFGQNIYAIDKDHFLNYPLLTFKLVYFQLWCQILEIILKKEHLTKAGLLKIIALKSHFKKVLSEKLKSNFSNFIQIDKPSYTPNFWRLLNIFWIAGFYNEDGSFYICTTLNKTNSRIKYYYGIDLIQDQISYIVLEAILSFFGFGKIYSQGKKSSAFTYRLTTLKDINKFIKIFDEAQLFGSNALDYRDFKLCIEIINKKYHLQIIGQKKIFTIKENLNLKRTKFI